MPLFLSSLFARVVAPALRAEWRSDARRIGDKFIARLDDHRRAAAIAGDELAARLRPDALANAIAPALRNEWRRDVKQAREKLAAILDATRTEVRQDRDKLAERLDRTRERAAALESTVEALTTQVARMEHENRLFRATVAINAQQRDRRHPAEALDPTRVAGHIRQAIADAPMGTDPMAHLAIESLLPPDTYAAMLDALPPRFFFTHGAATKPDLKLGPNDIAPEWTHRCISFLQRVIVPAMVSPLLARFGGQLEAAYADAQGAARGAELAAAPHAATGGRLMVREPGYHIDPHLDPQRSIISCLIYFARPGDDERYGTQLFRIEGKPQIDRTNTFYPGRLGYACTLVKTVPFTANSAVAFLNAGGAHGADIPSTAPAGLERYSYQFYVSADRGASE